MKKYDWYWMTNPDWWEMIDFSPILRLDAPREAQESYERYLLQMHDCNTANIQFIGQCKEVYHDDTLPSIYSLIGDEKAVDKNEIWIYLNNARYVCSTHLPAFDVITGEKLQENLKIFSDGIFVWRSDIWHYFEKYNFKLDADFLKHVRSQKNSTFLTKEYRRICNKLGFTPSKYVPPDFDTEDDNWENPFLKLTSEEHDFLYENGFFHSEKAIVLNEQSAEG